MKPNKNSLTTKNLRSIARGLVFVMLFLALYVVLSMVFTPKVDGEPGGMTNDITYSYRAESKNSVDVVFIGNSDVARGINPAQIYRDTGIQRKSIVSRNDKGLFVRNGGQNRFRSCVLLACHEIS